MKRLRHAAPALVLALGSTAIAQDAAPKIADCRAALIAETPTARPGTELSVGVRLVLAPGRHVYWKYPGDSGAAPVVDWKLPEGWVAGPIAWPTPHRLVQDGLVSYVYEGEVLLPVSLQVPAGAAAGDAILGATVHWVACSDEACTSGSDACQARVEIREDPPVADPAHAAAFAAARASLPKELPAGAATLEEFSGGIVLVVKGLEGSSAEFFPSDPLTLDETRPAVFDPTSPVALRIRLFPAPRRKEPVTRLRGVLVVHLDGSTASWTIHATTPERPPR